MKYDVMDVADQIMKASKRIMDEVERAEQENLIDKKATTARDYDKAIGTATGELKLAGEPVTLIRDQAKKRAADFLYDSIIAEEGLKAHYSKLDVYSKVLNALQSVFRHLSNIPEKE